MTYSDFIGYSLYTWCFTFVLFWQLKGRTIRVDHVSNYRPPKDGEDVDDVTQALRERGCGARTPSPSSPSSEEDIEELERPKKGIPLSMIADQGSDENTLDLSLCCSRMAVTVQDFSNGI